MNRTDKEKAEMYRRQLGGTQAALSRQERRNAELCERVDALEKLLAALVDAPCTTCDPWDEGFRCGHNDGGCQLVAEAMELGIGG